MQNAVTLLDPTTRAGLRAGILHIGVGNFHRAHLAVYLDDLMAKGLALDWAIIGAGVRPADERMRAALQAQDYLSTVIELDPAGKSARRIGAMIDFLPVEADNRSLIARMAQADIRIVSLTVTEGGYYVDPSSGRFDPSHPDIVRDGANLAAPATAFGAIVAALQARRAAGTAAFTVMSCDNLPGNGDVTRAAVVGLARLADPALAAWIEAQVAFPNAMVDRITPATGPRERAIAAGFGLADDPVPVTCEPFRQWVIEDHFPAGRPPFEQVGVTFTDQVHAFEMMKIRILNGGHAIIAYAGGLKGIHFVHEAMEDPTIRAFLDKIESREIIPLVPPVPQTDLVAYKALIMDRFSNPEVADTIRRLCLDGSNRQPKFILPSIRDALAQGKPADGLILAHALWARYCAGHDEAGREIEPNDPDWDRLTALAQEARHDPAAWLRQDDLYGDLARNDAFRSGFAAALAEVWANGAEAAMLRYIGGN